MTENLRYIGPTTAEHQDGEVYPLLMAVHQGFLELKKPGGHPMKYASLDMLLKNWQLASHSYAERDPNGQALADMGIAYS